MRYHILNGDSLLDRFPPDLSGERIVFRESLVDGPSPELIFPSFFQKRFAFLQEAYDVSEADYQANTQQELERILDIVPSSEVNLWFEEDLFCQVNLWCVFSMLKSRLESLDLYLVLPGGDIRWGFAGLSEKELEEAFARRTPVDQGDRSLMSRLWPAYRLHDTEQLRRLSRALADKYPFLPRAVEAHLDRLPGKDIPGRPLCTLRRLKAELGDDFGQVFQAFSREEPVYGFGDLQVKRLWEQLKD